MVKAFFNNIHLQIIHQIENAQYDIKICVAWFTDYEIYEKLVTKVKEGLSVEVIIANHEFNKKSKVDFKEFLKHNGKVSYLGSLNGNKKDSFMHNKFCIIDNRIVISGSYNWTKKARLNDENILVVTDNNDLTAQFVSKFQDLKPQFGFALKNNSVELMPIEKIMNKWEKKTTLNKKVSKKRSSSILDKI